MPTERPAPKLPGAGGARLHRWIDGAGSRRCAECGVEESDRTRFSFCEGTPRTPPSR